MKLSVLSPAMPKMLGIRIKKTSAIGPWNSLPFPQSSDGPWINARQLGRCVKSTKEKHSLQLQSVMMLSSNITK